MLTYSQVFSMLHNFALTLEKAHKFNLDRDAEAASRARKEEEGKKRCANHALRG